MSVAGANDVQLLEASDLEKRINFETIVQQFRVHHIKVSEEALDFDFF